MKNSLGLIAVIAIALTMTACASTSEKTANLSSEGSSPAKSASTLSNAGAAHQQSGWGRAQRNNAVERRSSGSATGSVSTR